jgi:16S rRNA (guanine966-N2)-methyltransferase
MKISTGWAKGMQLKSSKGDQTRPTLAKTRASVFNTLQPFLHGAVIWDLYAGTGAMGIEAVSRGARQGIWVERDRKSFDFLNNNINELMRRDQTQKLGFGPFEAVLSSVEKFLSHPPQNQQRPDIIWVDPPYQDVIAFAENFEGKCSELLNDNGLLVIESAVKDRQKLEELLVGRGRTPEKIKIYGGTMVSFWRKLG